MSAVSQFAALAGRWSWRRFERATQHPEQVQRNLLQRILKSNQDTAYGRQHWIFEDDFGPGLPGRCAGRRLRGLSPWVDRLKEGERRVLTSEDPYLFSLTSGPAAAEVHSNQRVRRTHGQESIPTLALPVPGGPSQRAQRQSIGDRQPCGGRPHRQRHPFGSASGYIYQNAFWALRRRYAVPYPVFAIRDYGAKYYAIMRFAIEQRLSLIATPNPSTILRLAVTADSHRDQLFKDIHDGAVSKDFDISSEVLQQVRPLLKPNPRRARELERIVARTGSLRPKDYWPDLALVGCWKGGSVGSTVDRLRPWFSTGMPFPGILDIGQ